MWVIIVSCLIVSNIITVWWALTKRVRISNQVRALQKALAAFQVEGHTLLEIRRINPDTIFMRNPER